MIRFFLLFLFSFSLNCLAIEAHKAEYILSLYESTQSSGIYGIEGKSIYTLKEECSGWDSEEDLMVNFQLQDNVESKLISKWATFETFSGKSYQFDLVSFRILMSNVFAFRTPKLVVIRDRRIGLLVCLTPGSSSWWN